MRENFRDGGSRIGFFVCGALAGAAIGLLFAPKSGRESRKFIAEQARQGKDYVTEKARQGTDYVALQARRLGERAQETFGHGKEYLAQQAENVRGAVDEGRRTFERELHRTSKAV